MIVRTIKAMRCAALCFSCNEFLGGFASQKETIKEMRCAALCFSCNEFLGGFASQKENN